MNSVMMCANQSHPGEGSGAKKPRKKRHYPLQPAKDRFEKLCLLTSGPHQPMTTPCKVWTGKGLNFHMGKKDGSPYGPYYLRAAAELAGADIPPGYHKWAAICGTPKCCAADHLAMDGEPVPGIAQAEPTNPK